MTAPIPREIPDLPAVPATTPPLLRAPVPAAAVVAPVRRPAVALFRLLTAVVAAAGVALELLLGTPDRTLSYFGVQANILLAIAMFLSASRARRARRPLSPTVTGATLLYVVITALVYHLLLAHTTPPFSMTAATTAPVRWHGQWATLQILHTIAPTAAVLDWLLLTPAARLHLRQAATWLLYPLAYLAFLLGRAAVLTPSSPARYLYPFLDVAAHGYRGTLANALLLGLAMYALAVFLVAIDHTRPTPVRRRV
ncbi:integral membrane regulator [Streptomyces sp. IMTB 2501]|uniref:Pr6Pr family membrane protein n=1 Tax=Streptomyces sp. IMTB 2501 TaxID=1776340 RepID=UPI00096CC714|nr:Pr6Pr family membrane protein [Streptomyces sp. IMTB 2501]OLZ64659.1 integral membrane regulator [Streptomyces sp. IMTB 2501]